MSVSGVGAERTRAVFRAMLAAGGAVTLPASIAAASRQCQPLAIEEHDDQHFPQTRVRYHPSRTQWLTLRLRGAALRQALPQSAAPVDGAGENVASGYQPMSST